jgi:hypothetical protein
VCFVLSCTFLKQVFSFTLIHRWQWICFFCHSHNPFLLSFFMTYQLIVNQSNMTDVTSGVGTAHPSKAHEFSPGFSWGTSCFRCLWCAVFCGPLFVFIPPLPGGGGGYTVLPLSVCPFVLPSVWPSFLHIFLSNYWWQKSDILSQASYRYPISWEAFLDPSDSYFLYADLVGFIHIEHNAHFSSHFSQQLLMAEIWYLVTNFIWVPHIVGSVFGSIRFLLPVCRRAGVS